MEQQFCNHIQLQKSNPSSNYKIDYCS